MGHVAVKVLRGRIRIPPDTLWQFKTYVPRVTSGDEASSDKGDRATLLPGVWNSQDGAFGIGGSRKIDTAAFSKCPGGGRRQHSFGSCPFSSALESSDFFHAKS